MAPRSSNIYVRYVTDYADGGTRQLLAEDRKVRSSVRQTSAQMSASARQAATASGRQVAAHRRQAGAANQLATTTRNAARAEQAEARAASASAGAHSRGIVSAQRHARSYDQIARSAQRAERAQRAATARARGQLATGVSSARATAGFAGAFGIAGALSQTIKFDRAMRNVNSIAQIGERRFQALSKSVRELGGQTAQMPETLAKGLYDLVSSGFDAKESMLILSSSAKAATAGLTTAEVSTKAVAAVLNAYHLPAGRAALVSDQLFRTVDRGVISFESLAENVGDVLPFASSLGIELDQVGASIATMTKAGVSAPETMTRIKAVMVTLLKPGTDLKNTLTDLGYESGEALIKQKGFQGALEELAKATGGSKEELAALFPNVRALGGALALTGKNARGARGDLDGMGKSAGATDRALREQAKSTAYQWDLLKANASSLGVTIGNRVLPVLNELITGALTFGRAHPNVLKVAGALLGVSVAVKAIRFTSAVLGITDLIRLLGKLRAMGPAQLIASRVGVAGASSAAVAGSLAGGALTAADIRQGARQSGIGGALSRAPIVGGFVSAGRAAARGDIGGVAGGLATAASPAVRIAGMLDRNLFGGAITKSLKSAGQQIGRWASRAGRWFEPIIDAASTAFSSITSAAGKLPGQAGRALQAVPRLAARAFSTLASAAGRAVVATGAAILKLPGLIARVLPKLAGWAGKAVGFFLTLPIRVPLALAKLEVTLVKFAVQAGRALATALPKAAAGLWRFVRSIPGRAGDLVATLPRVLGRTAGRAGTALINNFRDGVSGLWGFAKSIPRRVGDLVATLPGTVGRLGTRGGSALLSGLKSGASGVWEWAKKVPGRIVAGISSLGGKLKTLAIDSIKAFTSGFISQIQDLIDKLKDAANDVKNAIPDVTPWDGFVPGARAGGAFSGPVLLSPGELAIEPSGRAWTVPGQRAAADNVLAHLPGGTSIITGHGQQLLAGGASIGEVLAHQAPHFRTGGIISTNQVPRFSTGGQVAASTYKAGLRGNRLVTGVAVSGAESRWDEKAHGDRTLGGSYGWYQVHHPSHPQYPIEKLLTGDYNARAAAQISSGGSNWAPWTTFRTGAYRGWLARARRAVANMGSVGNRDRSMKIALPPRLEFGGRLPSGAAAWRSGFEAGLEGLPLAEAGIMPDIAAAARSKLIRRTKTVNVRGRPAPSGPTGGRQRGVPPLISKLVTVMRGIHARNIPYVYGGGHVDPARVTNGGLDCSSAVAMAYQQAGFRWPTAMSGDYMNYGRPGRGKHTAVFSNPGHTFMAVRRRPAGAWHYWGTGSSVRNGSPSWQGTSYDTGGFTARHIPGYRTGGQIGQGRQRLAAPSAGALQGLLGLGVGSRRVPAAIREYGRSIALLDDATESILKQRVRDLRREAEKLRRAPGRFRRMAAGQLAARAEALERAFAPGGLSRRERGRLAPLRRELTRRGQLAGVRDEIRETRGRLRVERPTYGGLERTERQLGRRIGRLSAGSENREQRVAIRRLEAAQRVVQTEMGRRTGLMVRGVERQAEALERGRTRLSQMLRRRGIDEASSAGLKAVAAFTATQVDTLKASERKLRVALRRAQRRGDRSAVADITDRLKGVRDEIGEAATSWIEQIRDQVRAGAQERVDTAAHGTSLASMRVQRFELEQQLAGTAETGGAARADRIRTELVPALAGEMAALQAQFAAAQSIGDVPLAQQIAEAIAAKDIEQLQALVDIKEATESTAENTEDLLKEFAGALGFEYQGQGYTDRDLAALPTGA